MTWGLHNLRYSDKNGMDLQIVNWITVLLSAWSKVLKITKYSHNSCFQIIQRVTVVHSTGSEVLKISKYSDNYCVQIVEWVTVALNVGSEVLKMSKYSHNSCFQIIQRGTVVHSAGSEVLKMLKYSDNSCFQFVAWVTVVHSVGSKVLLISKYSHNSCFQIVEWVTVVLIAGVKYSDCRSNQATFTFKSFKGWLYYSLWGLKYLQLHRLRMRQCTFHLLFSIPMNKALIEHYINYNDKHQYYWHLRGGSSFAVAVQPGLICLVEETRFLMAF